MKSTHFRKLESLKEYALVWQDEPHIEIFRRQADSIWQFSEAVGLNSSCRFESVDCTIPLSEIYAKVTFGEAESAPTV